MEYKSGFLYFLNVLCKTIVEYPGRIKEDLKHLNSMYLSNYSYIIQIPESSTLSSISAPHLHSIASSKYWHCYHQATSIFST